MKRIIALIFVLCLAAVPALAEEGERETVRLAVVYIGGEIVSFPELPFDVDGNAVVPIRPIADKLGFSLDWDSQSQAVTLASPGGENTFTFTVGSSSYTLNEKLLSMPVEAEVRNGITYVPAYVLLPNLAQIIDKKIELKNIVIVPNELLPINEEHEFFYGRLKAKMPEGSKAESDARVGYYIDVPRHITDSIYSVYSSSVVINAVSLSCVSVGDLGQDAVNLGLCALEEPREQNGLTLLEISSQPANDSFAMSRKYLVCEGDGQLSCVNVAVGLGRLNYNGANAVINEIVSSLEAGNPSGEKVNATSLEKGHAYQSVEGLYISPGEGYDINYNELRRYRSFERFRGSAWVIEKNSDEKDKLLFVIDNSDVSNFGSTMYHMYVGHGDPKRYGTGTFLGNEIIWYELDDGSIIAAGKDHSTDPYYTSWYFYIVNATDAEKIELINAVSNAELTEEIDNILRRM